jgi:hypothetical protein
MGSNFNFHGKVDGQGHIFGDHGRIENRFGATLEAEERRRLVEELVQEVKAHESELPDPDGLLSTTEELGAELHRAEPRRGILRRLVNNLVLGAAGVTAVAEAVDKVRKALGLGA